MGVKRQKTIGITVKEKATLDMYKADYEEATGEACDWGKFLTSAVQLASVALEFGYRVRITECTQVVLPQGAKGFKK